MTSEVNFTIRDIDFYKSYFRVRQDIYAIRWEKDGKSGYMPAYKVDWTDYRHHRSTGGSFKDYSKKEYQPLTDEMLVWAFPWCRNDWYIPASRRYTSFLIAADFDESNWKESILKLYKVCSRHKIPSCIERSRSGKGGHLWIFLKKISRQRRLEN